MARHVLLPRGMSPLRVASAATFLSVLLPACSTVYIEPDGTGGGGADISSGATSTDAASTGSGGICSTFDDQEGSGPVTMRVINESPKDIYLRAACSTAEYTIVGADQQSWNDTASCTLSCEELQSQTPIVCGACPPTVLLVPAHGSRDVVWSGLDMTITEMPASCWFDPDAGPQCVREMAAPAQRYQAVLAGYDACDAGNGDPCTCDPSGSCTGFAEGQLVNPLAAFFDYPSEQQVDVVFDSCVFGCPGGDVP